MVCSVPQLVAHWDAGGSTSHTSSSLAQTLFSYFLLQKDMIHPTTVSVCQAPAAASSSRLSQDPR